MNFVFLQSFRVQQVAPSPFTQGRQKGLFNSGSPKSVSFLGRGERNGVFIINFAKIYSNTEFLSTRLPLRYQKVKSLNSTVEEKYKALNLTVKRLELFIIEFLNLIID